MRPSPVSRTSRSTAGPSWERRRTTLPPGRFSRIAPYLAGLLGVFLMGLAGNLDGVGQMVERLSEVSSFHLNSGIPVLESVVNSAGGAWQIVFHGAAREVVEDLVRFDLAAMRRRRRASAL